MESVSKRHGRQVHEQAVDEVLGRQATMMHMGFELINSLRLWTTIWNLQSDLAEILSSCPFPRRDRG